MWQDEPGARAAQRSGDPLAELPHYSVCIYAHDGAGRSELVYEDAVLPWPECGEPPCWEGSRRTGFTYRRGEAEMPGAVQTLVVPPKRGIGSGPFVRGIGEKGFDRVGESYTVQLVVRDGGHPRCWSTTHSRVIPGLDECAALTPEEP